MRLGTQVVRAFHSDEGVVRVTRSRLIEIGVAIVLTMAALLFVAWAAWAAEGINVTDGWARPTIGEGRKTAAYMTITNAGDQDDVLKAAKSPRAKDVELHETKMTEDGIMQMRPLEGGLPVAAGATVAFKPGGLHVMVMGLDGPLDEGAELPLTLEFEKAGPVEIMVPAKTGIGEDHAHH
jgi:periplasmic copper chaperone A